MSSAPRPANGPQGQTSHRTRQNVFICALLLLQIGLPPSYYLSGRGYDERFSWRMFSTLRLRDCKVEVTEHVPGENGTQARRVNVEQDVHIAWLRLLERMRTGVVDAYLKRRCEASEVQRVDFVCRCNDTDGRALPPLERSLSCVGGAR